jgi:hypothetical protein
MNYACVVAFISGVAAPIGIGLSIWALAEWWRVGRVERVISQAVVERR